jgi:hypothetical protein
MHAPLSLERDVAPLSHVICSDHQSKVGSCGLLVRSRSVSHPLQFVIIFLDGPYSSLVEILWP